MNDAEMMKHFGVFLLGDIEQEPWIRLSMSTVRDMVTQAWGEGYRALQEGVNSYDNGFEFPKNPYEWSRQ